MQVEKGEFLLEVIINTYKLVVTTVTLRLLVKPLDRHKEISLVFKKKLLFNIKFVFNYFENVLRGCFVRFLWIFSLGNAWTFILFTTNRYMIFVCYSIECIYYAWSYIELLERSNTILKVFIRENSSIEKLIGFILCLPKNKMYKPR